MLATIWNAGVLARRRSEPATLDQVADFVGDLAAPVINDLASPVARPHWSSWQADYPELFSLAGIDPKATTFTRQQVETAAKIAMELAEKAAFDKKTASKSGIKSAAAKATRDRLQEILYCSAAAGKDELANHLAFETDAPAEEAIAMLKLAPLPKRASRLDGVVPDPQIGVIAQEDPYVMFQDQQAGPAAGWGRAVAAVNSESKKR
jgi:hypothetical protein